VAKTYLRNVKRCSSRSYDAITAHTAITCAAYIMLAELQRVYQDTRPISDLFFDAFDELQDIPISKRWCSSFRLCFTQSLNP
jgi:hypothetical protein